MINELNPEIVGAYYVLRIIDSQDLINIAIEWLQVGIESESIVLLAGEVNPSMVDAGELFENCLSEIGVRIPTKQKAVQELFTYYLRRIVDGSIPAFEGMKFIDNYLYSTTERSSKAEYLGEEWGLQSMYTWYRELQDAEDSSLLLYYTDLPLQEAKNKFEEHLREEAKVLYNKLCSK
jgi:hypothetical protein